MFVIVDTHVLIWLDQDETALGTKTRELIDFSLRNDHLGVSAISFWEVAMLINKGRLNMELPVDNWRRDLLGKGLVEIPLDGKVGITAAQLDLHGDPADRIITATAMHKKGVLLTADKLILGWQNQLERFDARL